MIISAKVGILAIVWVFIYIKIGNFFLSSILILGLGSTFLFFRNLYKSNGRNNHQIIWGDPSNPTFSLKNLKALCMQPSNIYLKVPMSKCALEFHLRDFKIASRSGISAMFRLFSPLTLSAHHIYFQATIRLRDNSEKVLSTWNFTCKVEKVEVSLFVLQFFNQVIALAISFFKRKFFDNSVATRSFEGKRKVKQYIIRASMNCFQLVTTFDEYITQIDIETSQPQTRENSILCFLHSCISFNHASSCVQYIEGTKDKTKSKVYLAFKTDVDGLIIQAQFNKKTKPSYEDKIPNLPLRCSSHFEVPQVSLSFYSSRNDCCMEQNLVLRTKKADFLLSISRLPKYISLSDDSDITSNDNSLKRESQLEKPVIVLLNEVELKVFGPTKEVKGRKIVQIKSAMVYEMNLTNVNIFDSGTNSVIEKLESTCRHTLQSPLLALKVLTVTISPICDSTKGLKVELELSRQADIQWTPLLQLQALLIGKSIDQIVSYIGTRIPFKKKKSSMKNKDTCIIIFNGHLLNFIIAVGLKSKISMDFHTISITIEMDKPELHPKKPNIQFLCKKICVGIAEGESSIHHFLSLETCSFQDVWRVAQFKEVESYMFENKRNPYISEVSSTWHLNDDLISNSDGQPLKEIVNIALSKVVVTVPSTLYVGQVLSDLLLCPKAIEEGFEYANINVATKKKAIKLQCLMSLTFSLQYMSILASHSHDSLMLNSNDNIPSVQTSCKDDKNLVRIDLYNFSLQIERNLSPSSTQFILKDLDEDPNVNVRYGPQIQGGYTTATIDHIVAILDPLTIATPLLKIQFLKYKGFLFLTEVASDTPRLLPGFYTIVPLIHRLSNSVEKNPEVQVNNKEKKHSFCDDEVKLYLRDIPPKLYIDGSLDAEQLSASFGVDVLHSIPALLGVIKQILPAPPIPTNPRPPLLPLTWWDNIRFMVHGKINLSLQHISFRWLLDSVSEEFLSILLKCENCDLEYRLGFAKATVNNLSLSLPGQPYPMDTKRPWTERKMNIRKEVCCSEEERHALMFIPTLLVDTEAVWTVLAPNLFPPNQHHGPYMIPLNSSLAEKKHSDKFHFFRSSGLKTELNISFPGNRSCANWFALRIENLPWITHTTSNRNPPSHKAENKNADEDDPLPKIDFLHVNVSVHEARVVLYDRKVDQSLYLKLPTTDVEFEATTNPCGPDQNEINEPNHSSNLQPIGTRFEVEGNIQAIMLELSGIHQNIIKKASFDSQDFDGFAFCKTMFFDEIEQKDRFCGSFGSKAVIHEKSIKLMDKAFHFQHQCEGQFNESEYFEILQKWSNDHSALAYIVELSNLIIVDGHVPIENLSMLRHKNTQKSNIAKGVGFTRTPSQYGLQSDLKNPRSLQHQEEQRGSGKQKIEAWTVIISGMKLLWTLEIRDMILSLVGDKLVETIHFMVVQLKEMSLLKESFVDDESNESKHEHDKIPSKSQQKKSRKGKRSDLMYLLQKNIESKVGMITKKKENGDEFDELVSNYQSDTRYHFHTDKDVKKKDRSDKTSENVSSASEKDDIIPTVDIHLFNPQIQFHSESTGGSIILVMKGAHVEGRKYKHFFCECTPTPPLNDAFLRKVDFTYKLDSVEGYSCAELGTDGNLQWLNSQLIGATLLEDFKSNANSGISNDKNADEISNDNAMKDFQKILDPFTFLTRQVFYQPPTDLTEQELSYRFEHKCFTVLNKKPMDFMDIYVDELSFILDVNQFKTTSDLIRNVLLAPLPSELTKKFDEAKNSSKRKETAALHFLSNALNIDLTVHEEKIGDILRRLRQSRRGIHSDKQMRNELRKAALDLFNTLGKKTSQTIRYIKWNLSKAKWKISGDEYLDDVEIDFTELQGRHVFTNLGGVTSSIDLENIVIKNLKPSPESIQFDDPTSVLNTVLADEITPCQRCGNKYYLSQNETTSCNFHADDYGVPGKFCEETMRWLCCGKAFEVPGCKFRPHTGKERAVMIQVENLPQVFDNLSLYRHVEINMYPNTKHTMYIQITKSLADLFLCYFLGGIKQKEQQSKVQAQSQKKQRKDEYTQGYNDKLEVSTCNEPMSKPMNNFGTHIKKILKGNTESDRSMQQRARIYSSDAFKSVPKELDFDATSIRSNLKKSDEKKILESEQQSSARSENSSINSKFSRNTVDNLEDENRNLTLVEEEPEIFFINHWRIGNINIMISLCGFPIDASNLSISVGAFTKGYKIGHGSYLSRKYTNYLKQEVIRSATSSGFKKIFLESNKQNDPSQHQSSNASNPRDQTETFTKDDEAKIDLLLGSPNSIFRQNGKQI